MSEMSADDRGKIEQTDIDKFEAAPVIVKSVTYAQSVFSRLRQNHLKRIVLAKEIEGLIQGNPPYNVEELRKAGLQHIANFNDMSARGVYERACQAYWQLLHNTECIINFSVLLDDPEAMNYARILSRNWQKAIKKYWRSFAVNTASLTSQLVKVGISPVVFSDPRDPKWTVVEYNKFYVKDQAQSDLEELNCFAVETEYTIQFLWDIYKQMSTKPKTPTETADGMPENGKHGPWNIEEIGKLLVWATRSNSGATVNELDIFELERKYYNGDLSFANLPSDSIKIVSLFQKEYDGSFSRYMFVNNFPHEDFLFFQKSQYKSVDEFFILFTINPGEYTIHANRGYGHKMFSLMQAKTMMDCSIVDMVKWASTPFVKSPSLNSKDVDQIKFYPGVPTNLGSAEFVQNNLGANVQHVVTGADYINRQAQFNLTYSGADPSQPDPSQGSLSPSEARLRAFKEFSVLKNFIAHFYSIFDQVLQTMVVKMLRSKSGYPNHEMSNYWKTLCINEGVPEVIFETTGDSWLLPNHLEVTATRVAGAGSQVAQLIALQELQAIIGSFGPREEKEFKKDFIAATIGYEFTNKYLQEGDDVDEQAGGASLAAIENAIMQQGFSPVFSGDNEHRAHVATHMALGKNVVERLQQNQIDVIEADKIFTQLIPHTGDHVNALSRSVFTQKYFEDVKPAFDQLQKYATLIRRNAQQKAKADMEEQQRLSQEQTKVMSDEERKDFVTRRDEARKDEKLRAQSIRQERAGAVKESALLRKTESDIAIAQKKANVEVVNSTRKTTSDIVNSQRKQPQQENEMETSEGES